MSMSESLISNCCHFSNYSTWLCFHRNFKKI